MNYKENLVYNDLKILGEENSIQSQLDNVKESMINKAAELNEKKKFFKNNRVAFIERDVYKSVIKLPKTGQNGSEFPLCNLDIPITSNLLKIKKKFPTRHVNLKMNILEIMKFNNNLSIVNTTRNNQTRIISDRNIENTENNLVNSSSLKNSYNYFTPYQKHLYIRDLQRKNLQSKASKQCILDLDDKISMNPEDSLIIEDGNMNSRRKSLRNPNKQENINYIKKLKENIKSEKVIDNYRSKNHKISLEIHPNLNNLNTLPNNNSLQNSRITTLANNHSYMKSQVQTDLPNINSGRKQYSPNTKFQTLRLRKIAIARILSKEN